MDLSDKPELAYLGELIGTIQSAATDAKWLLVGAMARDLLTQFAHGIQAPRATLDVDLGVAVESWRHFEDVRQRLLDDGRFIEVPNVRHRLRFQGQVRVDVDLIPFGGVERADGMIAWPPDGDPELTVSGFSQALTSAVNIRLPGDHDVAVADLPMIIYLKLIACTERYNRRSGVDLTDVVFILANYLECGNQDRLIDAESDLLEDPDFDYELAGAILAGRDLRKILTASESTERSDIGRLQANIGSQLSSDRPGPMLQQLPAHQLDQSARLLESFLQGLSGEKLRNPDE